MRNRITQFKLIQMSNNNSPVEQVVSAELKDGELHIVKQVPGQVMNLKGRSFTPNRVWKEVYGVADGKVVLNRTVGEVPENTQVRKVSVPASTSNKKKLPPKKKNSDVQELQPE